MRYFAKPIQQVGWLFVLATAAGVLSVVVMRSTLGADELLVSVEANQTSMLLGNMLILLMLVAMTATAVLLAPILRRYSEALSMGYVLARTLEVATLAIGLAATLLLVPLSWSAIDAGNAPAAAELLAETLKTAGDWTGYLGAQMVFSLSALVLNGALHRYRLVPRWLSVWGLIGVPLMFLSGLLPMFESLNSDAATINILVVPLAVQEMAMAAWMIVKGFSDESAAEPTTVAPRRARL